MSVFLVYVRDDEENKPAVRMEGYYGGLDPPEPVWCADIVEAPTRGRAKSRFLDTRQLRDPIYYDDWNLLRVRLLTHDESMDEEGRWFRVHEVLEHGGKSCDCPTEEEADG